jgi:hypothetical protein
MTENDEEQSKSKPLNEITPKPLSVNLVYDVLDGPTQKVLNEGPLEEADALHFVRKLQESDAARPLVMRSRRAILQE